MTNIAILFPGQGSQKPSMGKPWVNTPIWENIKSASQITNISVESLLLDASEEELQQTDNAQLSMFVLCAGIADQVISHCKDINIQIRAFAGHSLGEYTALYANRAITFESAVKLVHIRGQAMKHAASIKTGSMSAVLGLPLEEVHAVCNLFDQVWAANDNAPGQVVIAGDIEQLDVIKPELLGAGAKRIIPLTVAGAFHTPFMEPAQILLDQGIAQTNFFDTDQPVISNVDATEHAEKNSWGELLSRQLCNPVLWQQSVLRLVELGITTFVECGPEPTLIPMAKRICKAYPEIQYFHIGSLEDLKKLPQ